MKTFILLLILLPVTNLAQLTETEVRQLVLSNKESEMVWHSSTLIKENYYYLAGILVDKLIEKQPDNANYNYRKGFLNLYAYTNWEAALTNLKKCEIHTSKNYDMYSIKEKTAPIDVLFHIGYAYHLGEQLEKAKEYYSKFIAQSNPKSELIQTAKLHLIQCDIAKKHIQEKTTHHITPISNQINTNFPEYASIISLDGRLMYFTSRRPWEDNSTDTFKDPQYNQFPEDIYWSKKNNDQIWSKPERWSNCSGENNEACVALTWDERKIFTYNDRTGQGDIYYSEYQQGEFQPEKPVTMKGVNSPNWETHFTITPNERELFFASERPGGYGGRDIYQCIKLPSGKWSEPKNLGPTINSIYDEDAPFISLDEKTLYFASNGEKSMGGFDILSVTRDGENNWTNPINLGYPINSTGDDSFYSTTASGTKAYLTSFRKDGAGEKDIYEITSNSTSNSSSVLLIGEINTPNNTAIPEEIVAVIRCLTCSENLPEIRKPRLSDGRFFYRLNPCNTYEIAYKKEQDTLAYVADTIQSNCTDNYSEQYVTILFDTEKEQFYPETRIELIGTVSDYLHHGKLAGVTIELLHTDKLVETMQTNETGYFQSNYLSTLTDIDSLAFRVRFSKNNYLSESYTLHELVGKENKTPVNVTLKEKKEKLDLIKLYDLEPIFFDLNKYDLRQASKEILDKIVKLLNDNPDVSIELGSHTDCRGTYAANNLLSKQRAQTAAEYLQIRVPNPNRITYKGYGESKLIHNCPCEGEVKSTCSEKEHEANRRIEFLIVE